MKGARLRLESAGSLLLASLGLRLLPFGLFLRCWEGLAPRRSRPQGPPARRICSSVQAWGRRLPGCRSCLVQSLAAALLLIRYGHGGRVKVGVQLKDQGLAAHAWLEVGSEVLLGEPAPSEGFQPIWQWQAEGLPPR